MKRRKLYRVLLSIVLWMLSLLVLVPAAMVIINSLKSKAEAAQMNISFPTSIHFFENYLQLIKDGGILLGLRNSVVITVICVFVLIIFCSAMAFVLERKKTKLSNILNTTIILGLVLPLQIIPTYFICNVLGITHEVAAILILIVANLSFSVFVYTGYIKGIPVEIDESAWLDGAGSFRLFKDIIFPLLQPVTITVLIINSMAIWNDFGISIYFLNNSSNYTLPLTIYNFFGNHNSDWQLVFADVVVTSLPVMIIYLVLQKYIISGMTAGAVKG